MYGQQFKCLEQTEEYGQSKVTDVLPLRESLQQNLMAGLKKYKEVLFLAFLQTVNLLYS